MPSVKDDRVAVFRFDLAAAGFADLDEGPRNALVCLLFADLLDLVAGDRPDFELTRLADAFDAAGFRTRAEGLPDFLRVFLDIRLPFVAFRGSIIEVLRQDGSGRLQAGLSGLFGLCSKGFRHATR